ncbi:hypothetical protein GCM10007162_04830 [Ignatzschineria ureiclastica]|nr:hypothetical protein GCM10007162_04830 [Ignatzschineria ureiclastica]
MINRITLSDYSDDFSELISTLFVVIMLNSSHSLGYRNTRLGSLIKLILNIGIIATMNIQQ